MSRIRRIALVCSLLGPLAGLAAAGAASSPEAAAIDPWVLDTGRAGTTEFLVVLHDQAPLQRARRLVGQRARGRYVYQRLTEAARRSQAPLLAVLESRGVPHRSYWIVNMVWVRGDAALAEDLARRPEVARIDGNRAHRIDLPQGPPSPAPATQSPEWGLLMVNADDVWALGYTGQGVVVAGQDTGYDWNHPALKEKYRGWDGTTADHDYNWHDAVHSGGGSCGADSPEPCDDNAHGTHTMGTMVGDDGGSNQVGMAPGARWIGCRNMNQGDGTPATYSECFQWFMAPTEIGGGNPDPDQAPQVINNSWSCPPVEGCAHDTLRQVVENTRAAGIAVVVSAGNSGPGCSTVNNPPGIYEASFSIGSTTVADAISSFSSRGPVLVDGSGRIKPDVSAPGSNVRSSVPGGGYSSFSGTSMASPHVAGMVALILSAAPALGGDVDAIENLIEASAAPKTSAQTCGDVSGDEIPNNTFGWGRIDALAAIEQLPQAEMAPARLKVLD